jgi:polyferredoxin
VEHWGAFGFIIVATGILYFNFAWFREQLCIVICPYGRLQSALIDDHSLVIGYDAKRGEPRGKPAARGIEGPPSVSAPQARPAGDASAAPRIVELARAEPAHASALAAGPVGDCVACNRCVQVCPTGIDIRHGLQMECIGCTACIDACDDVMTRLNRPRGLIRYDSQAAFAGERTRWLRPRTILYGVLLLIGATVAMWGLSTVKPASFGVTRMTGSPYIVDDATVRNQFLVRIVNKRNEPARFTVSVEHVPQGIRRIGFDGVVEIGALGELVRPLVLQQPRGTYTGPFRFEIRVEDEAETFHLERDVDFLGPEARLLREEEAQKK